MIFKDIKELMKSIKTIDNKVDEIRSLSVERSEFNRLYKRVNQIYFNNKDTQQVSLGQDSPVSLGDILRKMTADDDLTKIITTTYVSLSVLLKYVTGNVQEKELTEALSTLLLNKSRFKSSYLNGYDMIFILSNIDMDAINHISGIFEPIQESDKFAIINNKNDISSIAKRYPTLFISSTELSIFTVAGREVTITEHPSFIMTALTYLMDDDIDKLVFKNR